MRASKRTGARFAVRNFLAASLVAGAAATVASGATASAAGATKASKPVVGGVLTFLDPWSPNTLYPPNVGQYQNGGLIANITDRLVYQDPKTLKLYPWLATDWKWNTQDTQLDIDLKSGVTFSDGTPFDANAVKANFDVYGLGNATLGLAKSEVFNGYTHSVVVSPSKIAVFFSKPAPGFIEALATVNSGIVSVKTINQPLNAFASPSNIVGTGPFIVSKYVPNSETDLTVRKDYNWGPPVLGHKGRAYLDEIKEIVEPESSTAVGALESGQADVIRAVPPQNEAQLKAAGFELYAPQTLGSNQSYTFRPTNPLVSDVRVREAITRAVNMKQIWKSQLSPSYEIANSLLSDKAQGYTDLSRFYTYDPSLSKKLLTQAGWIPGPNGIRQKDGVPLALTLYTSGSGVDQLFQQQEAAVGVQINLLPTTTPNEATLIKDPTKTPIVQQDDGRASRDVLASFFSCTDRNVLETCIPSLERLFYQEETQVNVGKDIALVKQIQLYLARNYLSIPTYQDSQVFAAAKYVKNMGFQETGRIWLFNTWLAAH